MPVWESEDEPLARESWAGVALGLAVAGFVVLGLLWWVTGL